MCTKKLHGAFLSKLEPQASVAGIASETCSCDLHLGRWRVQADVGSSKGLESLQAIAS